MHTCSTHSFSKRLESAHRKHILIRIWLQNNIKPYDKTTKQSFE